MIKKILNFIQDTFITYVSLLMIVIGFEFLFSGINDTVILLIIASVGLNLIRLIDKKGKTNER